MLVIIMYFLVFAVSGSFRLSYLIINPILFGFGVAHSYIMDFRGTPLYTYGLFGNKDRYRCCEHI